MTDIEAKVADRLANTLPNESAQNWYKQSRQAIQEIYGGKWKLFAKCLAATSANSALRSNTTLARKAFNEITATGTIERSHFTRTHYKALLQVAKGRLPNGRKCKNFAKALLGDESCVVVDIWIMRYAGLPQKSPSARQYDIIEDTIKTEAKALGRTPAGHQAVLWAQARGSGSNYAQFLVQYRLF